MEPISFDGRRVMVTGGTGSLGTAVVRAVLEGGGEAVVPVFDRAELERFPFAEEPRVRLVLDADLTDAGAVDSVFEAAGEVWASVHVAGGFAYAPLAEAGADVLERMLSMNVRTSYLCSRAAAGRMRAAGSGGRIVNVGARNVLFAELGANMVAYTMSKAAVAAMTQALGAELAEDGILVNAVLPGVMDTPQNRDAMPDADFGAWTDVEDVARTISFLASPHNTTTRSALVPVYGRL